LPNHETAKTWGDTLGRSRGIDTTSLKEGNNLQNVDTSNYAVNANNSHKLTPTIRHSCVGRKDDGPDEGACLIMGLLLHVSVKIITVAGYADGFIPSGTLCFDRLRQFWRADNENP